MQALKIQQNLSSATDRMNTAMERMSSGSKINSAKDDAAGYAVSTSLSTDLSITNTASDNVAMGQDLLSAADGVLSVITDNLERIVDLLTQASTGTYSPDDLAAIVGEIHARGTEIEAQLTSTFNGIDLFGAGGAGGTTAVNIQTGSSSSVNIATGLANMALGTTYSSIAIGTAASAAAALTTLTGATGALSTVTTRATTVGALQNRLDAVSDALDVQATNLSSAISTIADADVAEESASYVQAQILQSASATLLVQANSAPQIALTLIQG